MDSVSLSKIFGDLDIVDLSYEKRILGTRICYQAYRVVEVFCGSEKGSYTQ